MAEASQVVREIEGLAASLRRTLSGASVDVSVYPSGGAMLDLRRDNRLFVMAYSPAQGFGVDEVVAGEGFQVAYRHQYDQLDPAAVKLRELAATSAVDSHVNGAEAFLNLVVIKTADLERARQFYASLGLELTAEKHGAGPAHYSSEHGGTVFEIYPRGAEDPVPAAVRLGFRVKEVDQTIERLKNLGATVVAPPRTSSWGRRAVLRDPDGHHVEITETIAASI